MLGLASGSALAQSPRSTLERTVLGGTRANVSSHFLMLPDCTSGGDVAARVTKAPKHGDVVIEPAAVVASYEKDTSFAQCNAKSVPGIKIYYKANENYQGADGFEVLIFYPNGTTRENRYVITVK
ncbi:hypothetical protein NK718_15970 [Alsobacter sp. SYSU M60028]|uniref:Uncharacterized protein n=1 Tax=Alsobacter ponti TaxID=2962936 RepID=A0ABT1LF11_9HYPH|nr:hypothetical protein [Alsobacter ponti]MCP8940024.1 hypothetical protein [Alsobacter ponti]